jgi:hypothetical protein
MIFIMSTFSNHQTVFSNHVVTYNFLHEPEKKILTQSHGSVDLDDLLNE